MTLMPSIQSEVRDNIVAAIKALPNWPASVPVEKVGFSADVFRRGHRCMVGVASTTDEWQSLNLNLGDAVDQPAEMDIEIVVYATSELSPTGALDPDDGNIDGLVSAILGSHRGGYGPGIRNTDVGVPFQTGGVYCRAVKTYLIADQARAEGSGGALAKCILMRTTTLPL